MAGLMLKIRTWWETADRTQKAVTLFGGAFLVLLLGGTFYFASRPKMAMAYSGLSQADMGKVTLEVQKLGIPVEFDLQGNVKVPSDKVAEVRAKLAMAGITPASGTVGNEELSKLNLMIPPNVEQERLKSILEGELAKSIQQIDGVAAARVHLTRGERSAFATEKKPASASIFITEKAGGSMTPESARAIAMMVTNAVTGLEPSRVFVLDNAGRPLYDGSEANTSSGQASQKIEAERAEAMRRERDLQAKLDAVIGRGNSVVTVNVEMNFDRQTKEQIEEKATGKPIVEESAQETLGKGMASTAEPAGLAANTGTAAPSEPVSPGGASGYGGEKRYAQYPVNRTITKTEPALGSLKSMAIAVLVNQAKVQDTAPVEEFLKSYIGDNAAYTAKVTSIEFDTTAAEEAKKSAGAATSRQTMQQAMSLLPVLALIVVGVMVMKAIAKAAKSTTVSVQALPDGSLALSGPSHDPGYLASAHHDRHEPALEGANRPSHPTPMHSFEDVGDIETKQNKPLEQIKRMSHDRPESVAMLLKSWLLEERR